MTYSGGPVNLTGARMKIGKSFASSMAVMAVMFGSIAPAEASMSVSAKPYYVSSTTFGKGHFKTLSQRKFDGGHNYARVRVTVVKGDPDNYDARIKIMRPNGTRTFTHLPDGSFVTPWVLIDNGAGGYINVQVAERPDGQKAWKYTTMTIT